MCTYPGGALYPPSAPFPIPDAVEPPYAPMQCKCMCQHHQPFLNHLIVGTDVDALGAEFRSCLLDLLHQLRVRLGHVVEGEDSPAELEE